jgi:hypothetical protein
MYLSIGELNLLTIISTMKALTEFAFKEEYRRLKSIGDKLTETDSLIDWKSVCIFFNPYILTKQFPQVDLKLM